MPSWLDSWAQVMPTIARRWCLRHDQKDRLIPSPIYMERIMLVTNAVQSCQMIFMCAMTEDQLQYQIVTYLDVSLPNNCVYHHSPNEGKRHINYINRLKKLGTKYGWPDLEIFVPKDRHQKRPCSNILHRVKNQARIYERKPKTMRDELLNAGQVGAVQIC